MVSLCTSFTTKLDKLYTNSILLKLNNQNLSLVHVNNHIYLLFYLWASKTAFTS